MHKETQLRNKPGLLMFIRTSAYCSSSFGQSSELSNYYRRVGWIQKSTLQFRGLSPPGLQSCTVMCSLSSCKACQGERLQGKIISWLTGFNPGSYLYIFLYHDVAEWYFWPSWLKQCFNTVTVLHKHNKFATRAVCRKSALGPLWTGWTVDLDSSQHSQTPLKHALGFSLTVVSLSKLYLGLKQ